MSGCHLFEQSRQDWVSHDLSHLSSRQSLSRLCLQWYALLQALVWSITMVMMTRQRRRRMRRRGLW